MPHREVQGERDRLEKMFRINETPVTLPDNQIPESKMHITKILMLVLLLQIFLLLVLLLQIVLFLSGPSYKIKTSV